MSALFVDKHRSAAGSSCGLAAATPTAEVTGGSAASPPPHRMPTPPLDSLIFRLVKYRRPMRMNVLAVHLQIANLQPDDLLPIPPTSREGPGSWPLYQNHVFEIRCMAWLRGQRSTVHDHCGSRCCVYVVEGVLTNIDFRKDSRGVVRPIRRCRRTAGEILPREHLEIHQIANEHPRGKRLVTLHLYSPPLSDRRAIYNNADR